MLRSYGLSQNLTEGGRNLIRTILFGSSHFDDLTALTPGDELLGGNSTNVVCGHHRNFRERGNECRQHPLTLHHPEDRSPVLHEIRRTENRQILDRSCQHLFAIANGLYWSGPLGDVATY